MPTSTLSSKGQVTVPKEVRDRLGIRRGDRLDFVLEKDGSVSLRPLRGSISELAGLLYREGRRTVSIREIDESIGDFLAADDERIRSGR